MIRPHLESNFLYVTCQPGAEKALKAELGQQNPPLRLAFSRPGFVTFKSDSPLPAKLPRPSLLARAWGLNHGRLDAKDGSPSERVQHLKDWLESLKNPLHRLHLVQRDETLPGDEPLGFIASSWINPWRTELKSACLPPEGRALQGERVLDLIWVGPDEIWVGTHQHEAGVHSPFAGAKAPIELPRESPSRAWLKLEEAVQTHDLPLRSGDVAVEIGSAPGGASHALLSRGLEVVGIDPGAMDPRITRNPRFTHLQRVVGEVARGDLPESVEWILVDMNVEPRIALHHVDRLAARTGDTLLGLILTLKLNRWEMAREIPHWLEHIRGMGVSRVYATQLPTNRQEISVCGLTRRGLLRTGRTG